MGIHGARWGNGCASSRDVLDAFAQGGSDGVGMIQNVSSAIASAAGGLHTRSAPFESFQEGE